MYIAKVIGNVVSTTKCEKLTGLKLLLVQQIDMLTMKESGTPVVISDSVGAGVGEIVMVVTGGSSRLTEATTGKPVDATIVGIIDTIEIEDRMLFEKYPQQREEKPKEKPEEKQIEKQIVEPVVEQAVETVEKPLEEKPADEAPVNQPIFVSNIEAPGLTETEQEDAVVFEEKTDINSDIKTEEKTENKTFGSNSQRVTKKNEPDNNNRK